MFRIVDLLGRLMEKGMGGGGVMVNCRESQVSGAGVWGHRIELIFDT
jgi:hypothetical protein